MKHLTFIFLILLSLTSLAQNKTEEDYKKIIGEWTLLNREERRWVNNQIEIKDISPIDTVKVSFNSDFSITLKHSNSQEAKFKVKVKSKKIKITQISGKLNDELLEGEFIIILSNDNQNFELRYSGSPHDRVYFKK